MYTRPFFEPMMCRMDSYADLARTTGQETYSVVLSIYNANRKVSLTSCSLVFVAWGLLISTPSSPCFWSQRYYSTVLLFYDVSLVILSILQKAGLRD